MGFETNNYDDGESGPLMTEEEATRTARRYLLESIYHELENLHVIVQHGNPMDPYSCRKVVVASGAECINDAGVVPPMNYFNIDNMLTGDLSAGQALQQMQQRPQQQNQPQLPYGHQYPRAAAANNPVTMQVPIPKTRYRPSCRHRYRRFPAKRYSGNWGWIFCRTRLYHRSITSKSVSAAWSRSSSRSPAIG